MKIKKKHKRQPFKVDLTAEEKILMKSIRKNLKSARLRLGVLVRDVCETTKISSSLLWKYEIGSCNPNLIALFRLCKTYKISFSELLEEDLSLGLEMEIKKRRFEKKLNKIKEEIKLSSEDLKELI